MDWGLLALISLTVALSKLALDLGVFTPAAPAVSNQANQGAQSNGIISVTDYCLQKCGLLNT
jgi:hypothetical protein